MRPSSRKVGPLAIAALGVVYGDIGTSPLYALRECFSGVHVLPPTATNVLGVLSLIVYSLVLVVSVKYVAVVMRADNQGEGGILALTALIAPPVGDDAGPRPRTLVLMGVFGAALLYGDGMITPAITVLGAIEGLQLATPAFETLVVPASVLVLAMIFGVQRYGTQRVGRWFGPVMLVWFGVLAGLGAWWVARAPVVLTALDPRHAVRFFADNGVQGFLVLGSVFLVVTGGEALYADMGHFGKRPIRLAWFRLVLPSLLLNYCGQGALLLTAPSSISQPFFLMAPSWLLVPLVGLATAAAIIASQALISGAFSLTKQAVQMGYAPRLSIVHTSADEMGQVYVPLVNWALALGTMLIVLTFRSSSALAAAYGVAVTLTMILTVVLLYAVARRRWGWSSSKASLVTGGFLIVDAAFLAANAEKFAHGGWLPVAIGCVLLTVMTTWRTGRRLVAAGLAARSVPYAEFLRTLASAAPARVSGTAVYLTAQAGGAPVALVQNVTFNKTLHQSVVVLTLNTADVPRVADDRRLSVEVLGAGITAVRAVHGFMEHPSVPRLLEAAVAAGVVMDLDDVTYFLGRETILSSRPGGMAGWRERLFIVMSRNAARATAFFGLPPERVVELGVQVEV